MYILALDTECTGLDLKGKDRPFIVSTYDSDSFLNLWQAPVDIPSREPKWKKGDLVEIFNCLKKANKIVFHHAIFDIRALKLLGIWRESFWSKVEDTLIMSHVLNSRQSHKLKDRAYEDLGFSKDSEDKLQAITIKARSAAKTLGFEYAKDVEADYFLAKALTKLHPGKYQKDWETAVTDYAGNDALITFALWSLYKDIINKDFNEVYQRELRLIPVTMKLENAGLTYSVEQWDKAYIEYTNKVTQALDNTRKISEIDDLNLNSPKQLVHVLFEKYEFPILKLSTSGKQPSTEAQVIQQLYSVIEKTVDSSRKQFLENLIQFRLYNKSLQALASYKELASETKWSTYKRLQPSCNQSGTRTTRYSYSKPNLEQISKGKELENGNIVANVRQIFGPPPGKVWMAIDYAQLQLRILAVASNSKKMLEGFALGKDYHDYTAKEIYKTDKPTSHQRRVAKGVNFGITFGAGEMKISFLTGDSYAYEKFIKQFPDVKRYLETITEQCKKTGTVTTLGGYTLYTPPTAPYAGVCYICQGTEGDIVKNSMIDCDKVLPDYIRLLVMIHDELLFEFPTPFENYLTEARQIKTIMEESGRKLGIETPVDASLITESWDKKTPIEL